VLTVGETSDFAKRGGMIQFVMDGRRVRFELHLATAEQMGLNIRSDLLRVAVAVKRTSSEE
jgi:hypothetical protein